MKAGKFQQKLGMVNRWHKHGLDQFDYPSMVTTPLGYHGLNQTGLSAGILLPPLWSDCLEMTVEVTNGSNEHLFAGDYFSVPASLVHIANYWDLTDSTYLELGLSGMFGFNNRRGLAEEPGEEHEEPEVEHEDENEDRWEWQAAPYLTWWQNPWMRLRLEYDYHVPDAGPEDHRVLLQLTLETGPHKHEGRGGERYRPRCFDDACSRPHGHVHE